MSQVITLITDCTKDDCEGVATDGGTMHLEADPPSVVELDIDMTVSQVTLTCRECGTKYFTGDVEIYREDEV